MLNKQRVLLSVFLAATTLTSVCSGADSYLGPLTGETPTRYDDFLLFAPVLQHDHSPTDRYDGFFFNYDRLYWSMGRPDRKPIGSVTASGQQRFHVSAVNYTYFSPGGGDEGGGDEETGVIYPTAFAGQSSVFNGIVAPSANDNLIPQNNTIETAIPGSLDGYGNRFEFGYGSGKVGWMVSVLDGPKPHSTEFYGVDDKRLNHSSAANGLGGFSGIRFDDPRIVETDQTTPPGVDPIAGVPGIQGTLAIDGLLTVHVVFNDPFGLLRGFVDLGPDPDGIPDDVNDDTVINELDLVNLAVVFDEVMTVAWSNIDGVELMIVRRKIPTKGGMLIDASLGLRYLDFYDSFSVAALGGILADSNWLQETSNRMVGPQFALAFSKNHGRLQYGFNGRAFFAANFMSAQQNGTLAELLVPGPTNVPAFMVPTSFTHNISDERFSPVGELRAISSYQITRGIRAKVGWTALVMGEQTRASSSIAYNLPDLGIRNSREDVWAQGIDVSIEVNR